MSRTVRSVFAGLALFLGIFPLTLQKPGLPLDLKSDEPAYYLMALSLAEDRDLACDVGDIRRLANEFPYLETRNLILATDDGWQTVFFGKPYLVSLLAAPATALFGANGFVATNMALLLLSVWLGALYLRQWNSDGTALLFSTGFFLLSNAFSYVFWLHTEILCIASVTACLYLAFTPAPLTVPVTGWQRFRARFWNAAARPAWSGAAIIAAAYNKPVLALLGLPALWLAFRDTGWRGAAKWIAGAAGAGALVCGISIALIGHPSAYLGVERSGVKVLEFDRMPELPIARSEAYPEKLEEEIGPRNSWAWIFRLPEVDHRLPPNLLYFLVGRHTGLFVYAPFALLCLLLFLFSGRRPAERWILLAALAGVAFFFLTLIPFNWHGGGGFIGNRYFVNALPGLLFLATRIAPAWLTPAGYALAGLFVAPILFTPFGAPVPQGTLQAHVRNAPFRYLPFEDTLRRQIPGYRGQFGSDIYFFGRRDVVSTVGDSLWVTGGRPVEIWASTERRLERPVFQIETPLAPNRITLRFGRDEKQIHFQTAGDAGASRIVLDPGPPDVRRGDDGVEYFSYKMWVEADAQTFRTEVVHAKPPTEEEAAEERLPGARPRPEFEEVSFLVGAEVSYLGEESDLAADVYHLEWLAATPPPPSSWRAHRLLRIPVKVRNTSSVAWPVRGATQVSLSYHWLSEDGSTVVAEGLRSFFKESVPAGGTAEIDLEVATPRRPGKYLLRVQAVRERLAWFGDKDPATVRTLPVEILPDEED